MSCLSASRGVDDMSTTNGIAYKGFGNECFLVKMPSWHPSNHHHQHQHHHVQQRCHRNPCLISVIGAFSFGLLVGIFIPFVYLRADGSQALGATANSSAVLGNGTQASIAAAIENVFLNNSYSTRYAAQVRQADDSNLVNDYPTVSFIDKLRPVPGVTAPMGEASKMGEIDVVSDGVFWGRAIESRLPRGFGNQDQDVWRRYIRGMGVAVKMERGCGRMQNRLVTFQDGTRGCVRYRQNTDQIQGELFSFYLAQILGLNNLAPSTVSVVNLEEDLFKKIANDVAAAQWNSNRPVVLTQFVTNLDTADIPPVFKPVERHLNKHDVLNMTGNRLPPEEGNILKNLVELAQWSDLIIFDYLTANLDRIVNNLYNYQWNVNIMDAPAHNLAKKVDNDLLVFLDNESGLLHGYRLLKKYEIYHRTLLDNLCMFRKPTAEVIKQLKRDGNVGQLLKERFDTQTSAKVKEVLPTLPDKSVKTLNERIDRVYQQIAKCESIFRPENT